MDYTTEKASFYINNLCFFKKFLTHWEKVRKDCNTVLSFSDWDVLPADMYDTEKPGGLFHQASNKPLEKYIRYTFFSLGAFLIWESE